MMQLPQSFWSTHLFPKDGKSEPYSPANCIHFDYFNFLFLFSISGKLHKQFNENIIFILKFYKSSFCNWKN